MATIDVTVGLNDQATRKLKNIDRAANSLTTTLRAAGAAAAAFATGTVARGIISQYTQFERYRTVLTTFLGSQQKANAELKRLQTLANALPQDLADVTEAFTIFSRFGLDTSAKSLTAFSNIATANAKSFAQLGEAVADALTGEFERLKEFGIKVSKENDKFVARIGEDQVAVAGTTKELVAQLQKLGEEGGRFGGAAAANAETLGQSFSNLKGALFETSVLLGEELRPALKDAVDGITDFIRNNQELIKSIGQGLADAVRAAISATVFLYENIDILTRAAAAYLALRFANSFLVLAANMGTATIATKGLAAGIMTMGGNVGGTVAKVTGLSAVMRGLGTLATRLGPLLLNPWVGIPVAIGTAVASGLYYFRDAAIEVGQTSTNLGTVVQASFNIIRRKVANVATATGQYFTGAFNTAKERATDFANNIKFGEVFQKAAQLARDALVNLLAGIAAFVQFQIRNIGIIGQVFYAVFQNIADNVKKAYDFIANALKPVLETIATWATGAGEIFLGLYNSIKEKWYKIVDVVRDAMEAVGSRIKGGVNFIINAFRLAGAYIGGIINNIPEAWRGMIAYLLEKTTEFTYKFQAFGASIQLIWQKTIKFLANTFASFVAETGSIFNQAAGMLGFDPVFDTMGIESWASSFDAAIVRTENKIKGLEGAAASAAERASAHLEGVNLIPDIDAKEIMSQDSVKAIAERAGTYFGAIGDSLKNEMKAAGEAALDTLDQALKGATGDRVTLDQLVNDFRVSFDQIATDFKNNKDVINGAIDGISIEKLKEISANLANFIPPEAVAALEDEIARMEKAAKATKFYDDAILRASRNQGKLNDSLGETNDKLQEMADDKLPKVKEETDKTFNVTGQIADRFKQMIGGVSNTFTDVLLGMKDGFTALEDIALQSIRMIISTLIEAAIRAVFLRETINFGGGGVLGGLFAGLGSLGLGTLIPGLGALIGMGVAIGNISMRANGGPVRNGETYMVGERGPEMFVPNTSGSIVSNEEMNATKGEGDLSVNFTINAIDTQTGVEFLLENKRVITGVIQEAYMRRGTSGPLG